MLAPCTSCYSYCPLLLSGAALHAVAVLPVILGAVYFCDNLYDDSDLSLYMFCLVSGACSCCRGWGKGGRVIVMEGSSRDAGVKEVEPCIHTVCSCLYCFTVESHQYTLLSLLLF